MSDQQLEPKVEKKIFTISPSSLNTVETCGYLYKLQKVDRLEPIRTPRALDYGSLGHFMLHPFYFGQIVNPKPHHLEHPYARLLGLDRLDLIRIIKDIGTLYSLNTDLSAEDREKCIETFHDYANFYHDEFVVLDVEQAITRVLAETDNYIIVFEAISDLITWHNKLEKIIPVDHKWQGRDYTMAPTDHQITGTCWALNTDEFRINKILERKENKFVRDPFSYDPEQLEEWRVDAVRTALMAIEYREAGYYPRMRTSCGNSNFKCPMLEACKTIPSSRPNRFASAYRVREGGDINIFEKDKDKILKIIDMIFEAGKS